MLNSNYTNRLVELFPEENRLVRQARSGSFSAFAELYETYVERIHAYLYLLVPNDKTAEGLTFQVFFKAWEQFDQYRAFDLSFSGWLYSIAQDQVAYYHHTHKNTIIEHGYGTLALGTELDEKFQAIRDGLRFLPLEKQQALILKFIAGMSVEKIARIMRRDKNDVRDMQKHALQMLTGYLGDGKLTLRRSDWILEDCLVRLANGSSTVEDCLVRHIEHAVHLKPYLQTASLLYLGRTVKPSSTFIAYTRDALFQYMGTNPRQPRMIVSMPMIRRAALTFVVLVAALLVTGTASAQSALPGQPLYNWKRTSEQIWRVLSPNTVATDIALANRRLNEWIAVANDPSLNVSAQNNYQAALSRLGFVDDEESLPLIEFTLQEQQELLADADLSSPELDELLDDVSNTLHGNEPPPTVPVEVLPTATVAPPTPAIPTDRCIPNCEDDVIDEDLDDDQEDQDDKEDKEDKEDKDDKDEKDDKEKSIKED